jgi:hypothetical protein
MHGRILTPNFERRALINIDIERIPRKPSSVPRASIVVQDVMVTLGERANLMIVILYLIIFDPNTNKIQGLGIQYGVQYPMLVPAHNGNHPMKSLRFDLQSLCFVFFTVGKKRSVGRTVARGII